jgi:hypothetical protein
MGPQLEHPKFLHIPAHPLNETIAKAATNAVVILLAVAMK